MMYQNVTYFINKRIFVVIVAIFIQVIGFSQNPIITVSSPKVVEAGRYFQIEYSINVQPSTGFSLSSAKGIEQFGAGQSMQSFSNQNYNGKVTRTFTYTEIYTFKGTKAGMYKIPIASITVNGKSYKSKDKQVEIVGNAPSSQQNQSNNVRESKPETNNEDIFARVYVNKNQAYIGEPIYATIKIYTRKEFKLTNYTFPIFNGFYKKVLEEPKELKLEREEINGKEYYAVLFQKLVIYPQKSGKLTITPFKVDANVVIPVSNGFWSSYSVEQRKLTSKSVSINVLPFPNGKSTDFTGAVGEFTISAKTNVTQIPANEAITYKITIQGNGNMALIQKPTINFPKDFELYEPKVIDSYMSTTNGDKGEKSFEYVLIPRHEGNFTIPAVSFQYFNPSTKLYKTVKTNDIQLQVTKGTGNGTVSSNFTNAKQNVKYFNEDLHFIKTEKYVLQKQPTYWYGSIWYVMSFVVLLVSALVFGFVKRNTIELESNTQLFKHKLANKESKKRLKQARICLESNNDEQYYEEVSKALWGYIADKCMISQTDLHKDGIRYVLSSKNIEDSMIDELSQVMHQCEFARFAPKATVEGKEQLYVRAALIIQHFEQNI